MLTPLEIRRKIFHMFAGVAIAFLFYYDILTPRMMFEGAIIGVLLVLISKRVRLPFFGWFLEKFERPEELKRFPGRGTLFLFVGALAVMKLFPKDIALASIMILAFGDSFSHLFGGKFGRLVNIFNEKSKKLFEGTLVGFGAGFFSALIFVPAHEAFFGSFVAMAAEVVKFDLNENTIDDNLIVPVVAGTIMFLVRMYFI